MRDQSAASAGLSNAAIGRRALLVGLGASAIAVARGMDRVSSSAPLIQLPQSAKPTPTPTPKPTGSGHGYIDADKYYRAEHGDDWRPALQAAFAAGASLNKEVILQRAVYKCRQKPQPTSFDGLDYTDFSLFAVDASLRVRSSSATGSRIVRTAPDGSPFDQYDFTAFPGGYKNRGGGFWMKSNSTIPSEDPSLRSFACHGVLFDGQLRRSMGLTFLDNIFDKGFGQQNDHNGGNITFSGTATAPSGFIGWAGEQLYTSSIGGAEAARRTLTIDDYGEFGETAGSALNPNGITLKIGRCLLHDSGMGIEGWTGHNGGFLNATFRDCVQSSLQAGVFNQDPSRGGYYTYTQPVTGEIALGYLGITLVRSQLDIGSGMRGKIVATDSYTTIGGHSFLSGVDDVDIELVSRLESGGPDPALFMIGAGRALTNARARVTLERTASAEAAGMWFLHAVGWYGTLGSGNSALVKAGGLALCDPCCAAVADYSGPPPAITLI